jgi:hypothetical protein
MRRIARAAGIILMNLIGVYWRQSRILLPLVCLALELFASPASAETVRTVQTNSFIEWDSQKDGSDVTYAVQGVLIRFKAKSDSEDDTRATLTVRRKADGVAKTIQFLGGFEHPAAKFAVGQIDPDDPVPQIILSAYSGGAHCCNVRTVFVEADHKWRTFKLDAGLNADGNRFPKDEYGIGRPAFVLPDDRFAYAFSSFGGSWMPPRVFVVKNSAVVEVSGSKLYGTLYKRDMAEAKQECFDPKSDPFGACAGFVADGARLGQFCAAWGYLLDNYPKQPWTWGSFIVAGRDGNYRRALVVFLQEAGYLSRGDAQRCASRELSSPASEQSPL